MEFLLKKNRTKNLKGNTWKKIMNEENEWEHIVEN